MSQPTSTPYARPVVVGLDRSRHAWAAVEFAARLAQRRSLPLRVVHAVEPVEYAVRPDVGRTRDAQSVLRNAADRLVEDALDVLAAFYSDVPVASRVDSGSPSELLLQEAGGAHTIVLGSRGTGGFADLVVGSTTLHLTSHAPCPVVAVPAPGESGEDGRYGVVVGVDGSEISSAAIGYAFEEAALRSEPLVAVHAWHDVTRTGVGLMMPLGYDPEEVRTEERLVLSESMVGWQEKYPEVTVRGEVVLAHPVTALTAEAAGASLLVVGCRGRGSVRSALLGSVSHGVLHHATGPVAVVHAAH